MMGTIKNVKTERWSKCAVVDIPTPKDARLVYYNTYEWEFYFPKENNYMSFHDGQKSYILHCGKLVSANCVDVTGYRGTDKETLERVSSGESCFFNNGCENSKRRNASVTKDGDVYHVNDTMLDIEFDVCF